MNRYKVLLITLLASFFSGCASYRELVPLQNDEMRLISEIAMRRNDGNPPVPPEIKAVLTKTGGPNPPSNDLFVTIRTDIDTTGLKGWLGVASVDPTHKGERECLRIIENFRKAGLPREFTHLVVSADLPDRYSKPGNPFDTSDSISTLCAFLITEKELKNGSPPRQTIKNFHIQK